MFKSIITAVAATAIAVAGNAPAAVAGTGCVEMRNGWDVCTIDNGHYGTDAIGLFKYNTMVASMRVICTGNGGNRWSADRNTQYVSYADLKSVAAWWCDNY